MTVKSRSFFSSFGNAVSGLVNSVAVAREMNGLYDTPEAVFRARGTTRDAAMRAAMKRL
ncbi:hypothetical protein [Oricola indica]|uniref:hypothetical protein n=1 Tax=Oricola indica TaxID=2872591 RepID=UPI003CCC15A7